MAKKVMKKLKKRWRGKGLKMSVTEGGEGGKSKMIASCGFLENELRQADSVETLGVDLRTGVKGWERRKSEEEEVQGEILAHKQELNISKELHDIGVEKLLRAGMMPQGPGSHAVGMVRTERLKLRRQMAAAAAGKKSTTSLSYSWKYLALKLRRKFPPWPLSTGQKEFGLEKSITNRRKLG